MAGPHRKNSPSSMMAMLDAKPAVKGNNGQDGQNGQNGQNGQYWTDVGDHLSPLRKHLISTYLQVSDEEAMPLLGEYFGVALSFVALGALVRSSNSSKRKHKKMISEEEKLDIRSCSRFERMALESMLKESMERLGKLSKNAYDMEVRERNLVEENKEIMVARDKEKAQLLKRVADAEKVAHDLRALRKAEGRANERVMSIVAAKEQDWFKEKRNLQKEIEKLKETVTGMNREAKFQARRCRNPTCEHCKGIDRVVRNVKGRIFLRELHSLREASQAPLKREVVPSVGRQAEPSKVDPQEIEDDRLLMKAIELKKKQRECQNKAEKLQSGESSSAVTLSTSKEHLIKHQQDMESELASILESVGMLKQKSHLPLPGPSTSKKGLAMGEMLSVDNNEAHDGSAWEERTEEASVIPEPNMLDPTLEVADCASEQEESEPKVELEQALDLTNVEGMLSPQDETVLDSTIAELDTVVVDGAGEDGGISSSINEQQQVIDLDDDLVAFQERLSLEGGLVHPEHGSESKTLEEEKRNPVADIPTTADPATEEKTSNSSEGIEEGDAQEQQLTEEATTLSLDSGKSDAEGINVAENTANSSVENTLDDEQVLGIIEDDQNTHDDEQVLGVVEDDDTAEFSDALSLPLDPVTGVESLERDSSADLVSEQPEQNETEYDSAMDFNENWGFKDTISSTEQGFLENQDIPVFERKNSDDDLAGELPEPEEKRVYGLETLDSNNALSPTELSSTGEGMSQQEGEGVKGKDIATIEEVGSQNEEGLLVEKTGSAADVKAKSDTVIAHSLDVEPADIIT